MRVQHVDLEASQQGGEAPGEAGAEHTRFHDEPLGLGLVRQLAPLAAQRHHREAEAQGMEPPAALRAFAFRRRRAATSRTHATHACECRYAPGAWTSCQFSSARSSQSQIALIGGCHSSARRAATQATSSGSSATESVRGGKGIGHFRAEGAAKHGAERHLETLLPALREGLAQVGAEATVQRRLVDATVAA